MPAQLFAQSTAKPAQSLAARAPPRSTRVARPFARSARAPVRASAQSTRTPAQLSVLGRLAVRAHSARGFAPSLTANRAPRARASQARAEASRQEIEAFLALPAIALTVRACTATSARAAWQ